jgi:predicted nucleotidyltransferase
MMMMMMNSAVQVTHLEALEVARVFLSHPNVKSVAVVGSVAREKRGNDLDLVVVTTGVHYGTFVSKMREWHVWDTGETDYYESYKSARRVAALEGLRFGPGFRGWLDLVTRDFSLDVHVMPENWQDHIAETQEHLPHQDQHFVRNIAKDAVVLQPTSVCKGYVEEVIWP